MCAAVGSVGFFLLGIVTSDKGLGLEGVNNRICNCSLFVCRKIKRGKVQPGSVITLKRRNVTPCSY